MGFYIFSCIFLLISTYLLLFVHIPTYFHVYFYLYLTYLDIFLHIFMYISNYFYIFTTYFYLFLHIYSYFHVYFYLFLHIYSYFLHVEHYIYYYLPRELPASYFHQFIPISTYFLHIYLPTSARSLPRVLPASILVSIFNARVVKSTWMTSLKPVILITCSILTNQRARNVPGNLVHFIYVPDVPVIWYESGTKTSTPQDGKYLIF